MLKPKDYDRAAVYGDYTPLALGGHILTIKAVTESKSKNGQPMLEIFLDTAKSDKQPDYYEEQYRKDNSADKKWGCIVRQLIYDKDGNTNPNFKTFIASVENSNPGFHVTWGKGFENCFQDKLVGGIFGREQYKNQKNEFKFATRCRYFRSVDTVKQGVEVPEDKLMVGAGQPFAVVNDDVDDLPF